MQNTQLTRISPDYRDILPTEENAFNRDDFFAGFLRLTENFNPDEGRLGELARSLGRVIFMTAEALRFREIYNIIKNVIIRNNRGVIITFRDDNIYQILVSWGTESREYRSLPFNENNRYQGFEFWTGVDLFLHSIIGHSDYEFIYNLTPIDFITQLLQNTNLRVLLGATFPVLFARITKNCNNRKRDINNPFWKEKFCEIKNEELKIKGKLKVVEILDENTKGNLKSGDIFFGTTNGLYLLHDSSKIVYKEDNINDEEVTSIKNFARNKFYATTKTGDVYFLRTDRIVSDGHLIGEILPNIESSDLNKEIKLYYDKSGEKNKDWQTHKCTDLKNQYLWDMNKINLIDYEKMAFFGNNFLRTCLKSFQ